ncbi:MAG TPA: C39 family peptidase [Candidatus Saccharimonadales bacterium]|nr:C39 family peptidase [Candidatus Saccharimonadales bacterium]
MVVRFQSDEEDSGGNSGTGTFIVIVAVVVGVLYLFTVHFPSGKEPEIAANPPANNAAGPASDCWLGQPCVPAFSQCDPAWKDMRYGDGSMCANGCGPAAMAMIITALTGKRVTPDATAAYATANGQYFYDQYGRGHGSKHTIPAVLAPHWGLRAVKLRQTEADVKNAIAQGGLVIIAGNTRAPFTPAGHYIVVRAVKPDGSVVIGNSALPDTNNRTWNLGTEILPIARETSIYAIFR